MKCPKCGRENPDIRLFCSLCGELLPENEPETAPAPIEEPIAMEEPAHDKQRAEPVMKPMDELTDDADFFRNRQRSRRVIEEAWPEEAAPEKQKPQLKSLFDEPSEPPVSDGDSAYSRPAREAAPARPVLNRREAPADAGRASTLIPKRDEAMDPDDFFAVKGQVLPEYDDDSEPGESPGGSRRRSNKYEDEPPQSFVIRHMRGIVTLILLALTAIIMLIWVNTENAQLMLARSGIAWKSEPYIQLANNAYAAGDLSSAGYYYTEALNRDESNYNCAIMAANSYIEGGYTSNALNALRKCIELKPDDPELYVRLMELQGGYDMMDASDQSRINTGYEITGDSRLNMK